MAITFEVARHLPAKPERVFAALTDLGGVGAWMPGLVKIEPADAATMKVGGWRRELNPVVQCFAIELLNVWHT